MAKTISIPAGARTLFMFKSDIWPFKPEYPNAWRGEISLKVLVLGRALRLMYFPAKRQNDWRRVDYATCLNISPIWVKWFHLSAYRVAYGRHIIHLTIGHISFSVIPATNLSTL